ncbi:TonB-dependent receptor plug domain-containing protein [Altericroceibacterium endophyticum]|uniref:TonB-dependent receptor n=1 Tax=Altericroceibacterium endophyticum TaxID=1808508 RepID=A0A6I4T5Z7_9SPHN|nr:TonB-dependent receptor [Altericroceibacterium endophyticum]MXO66624.1 TonB-dependent receptor [Altericroceibacterium endophyticum]
MQINFLRLAMAAPLLFCAPSFAHAADDASTASAADTTIDQTIIVTGTREATRTQFDTIAPVDVLSDTAIDASVSDDLSDTLAQLLPSFNVQRLPAADGAAFVRPATLRGLSPDQTLVLVNGKRYHRSALLGNRGAQATDLASIPNSAIKRIEVLRDGASAQYGSDAIAGVINIILDDQPGIDGYGQFSQYYEGDGESYQGGLQAGFGLADRGSIVFSGEYNKSEATSRTRQRADAIAFQEANPDLDVPDPVQRWGQPELESFRAAVNADYEITDSAELYAFGTYNDGNGVTDFNWRNPANTGNVFKDTEAFPGFNFTSIYPTGFTPQFGTDYNDIQTAGGIRSADRLSDFTYDFSASWGRSQIDYNMSQSLNASLGPDSPTEFYLGQLEQREFNLNADFVYRLDTGGYAPINIAFGGERRVETYAITAGDPASYAIGPGAAEGLSANSNGFPGFSEDVAGEWDQTSYAGYADLEWQPVEMLTLGAAGRYEDFSEFGSKFTYKLSARTDLTDTFALRGTYATGFHAPTPGQLNTSKTTQGLDTNTMTIFTSGRLSPSDPIAVALGAEPLKPETSKSITLGFTAKPARGFQASVDLYRVDVDDRFGLSASQSVPDGVENPNGYSSVNYYTNDFATRTQGIDVVLSYQSRLGEGQFSGSLAYNYNDTNVRNGLSATIGSDEQRQRFENALPKHNATASLGYDIGRFGILARGRYYGSWTDYSDNADGQIFQDFGSMVLVDLSVDYDLTDNISLRVGAENLFDSYPDEATYQSVRGLIYSRNAPYDTDGGQYYVRVGFKF